MSDYLSMRMQGSVMIEFAGVIILLVFFVFGITEIGRAIYQLNTLTKTVETGARYISRYEGAVTVDHDVHTCTRGTEWSTAKTGAANIIMYGTDTVTASAKPRLPKLVVTIKEDATNPQWRYDGGNGDNGACVITVTAQATFVSLFGEYIVPPLFGKNDAYKGIVLHAKSEERYIGD